MLYRFRCPACERECVIEQSLNKDHSGKDVVCAHCQHGGLQRIFTAPNANRQPKFKQGLSNPFHTKKI